MMRRGAVGFLLVAAVGLPVYAEDAAGPQAKEAKLKELTAEYTQRYRTGDFADAIPFAEQALAAAEAAFGPEHERVAQVLNDLGQLHQSRGDLDQAERLHERALKIRERVFSADGPAMVQSLNNLAKVYAAQGRYAEAQAGFERSLSIAERHVEPTDPFLLTVLEPYAAVLRGAGNLKAAEAVETHIQHLRNLQRHP